MIKKLLLLVFVLSVLILPLKNVRAADLPEMNLFYSPTCPHCLAELSWLGTIQNKYPDLVVNRYNVFESNTSNLLKKFYSDYKVPKIRQGTVPITFLDDEYYYGFSDTIGNDIEYQIKTLSNKTVKEDKKKKQTSTSTSRNSLKIPFIGEFTLSNHSPLFLSIILGTLDGFNACAMIALGFLLAVLIATKLRKRVLLVGGTFIFVSGIVYFLFISAWLNLMLFLSNVQWITMTVGIVTIFFALFMLKDYIVGVVCKICQINPKGSNILNNWQKKLFTKMSQITSSKMPLPLMLLGVAVVAAGINTVELFCSFGFPLAFTNYLTTLNLPTSNYYFYLIIYVVFYMIDDFIIFMIALATLRITKMSDRYLRVIMLISSIVLLLLGVVMIMKGF